MKIKIKETNEIKDLTLIDPISQTEWTEEFISEDYVMTKERYCWWREMVNLYQAADNAAFDLAKTLDCNKIFVSCAHDAQNCDLENQSEAMMAVVEEFKLCIKHFVVLTNSVGSQRCKIKGA